MAEVTALVVAIVSNAPGGLQVLLPLRFLNPGSSEFPLRTVVTLTTEAEFIFFASSLECPGLAVQLYCTRYAVVYQSKFQYTLAPKPGIHFAAIAAADS